MTRLRFGLLVLPAIMLASCQGSGTGSLPVEITQVRVGIPPGPLGGNDDPGRRSAMYKAGHWTPVLVTLRGRGQIEGAELVVQTVDGDDVLNEYSVRLAALDFSPDQPEFSVVTYCRPGKADSSVTVSLRARGQTITFPERSTYALDPSHYLYVSIGARYPGLRLPGLDEKHLQQSEIGSIDVAGDLPRRWYAYETMDLVILGTSNDEFLSGLFNDTERREALVEWVRRGGRLILAVGRNQSLLQNREDLKEFLPVDFVGTATVPKARINWGTTVNDELGDPSGRTPLSIARVQPKSDRNVRILTEAKAEEPMTERFPLVLQAAYGLGRITILTVDPDQAPFTRWKSQGDFWTRLLNEAGPIYPSQGEAKANSLLATSDPSADSAAAQIISSLENFDGVPVISFSWVALFILLYIVVVGPLDYLFLKKVVKRMELTWVTFPLVVIVVSVAAYFSAHALKGGDQKINKVDLIDIDLATRTASGQSWFSVFSPRVQNYTVGVDPAEDWGLAREPISPPLVSWLARADTKGRTSLFRRSYDYDVTSGGLKRVPIQVWSTKGFHARWHHRLDPAAPPLEVNLRVVGDDLTGSITSHLPLPLEQVALFHRGRVYDLQTLNPGEANRVQVTRASRQSFEEWSRRNPAVVPGQPVVANPWQQAPPPILAPSDQVVRTFMFHEAFESGRARTPRNAGFRELDQSWRISGEDPGGAAILYGRLATKAGAANEVLKHPSMVTRLWLGELPDGQAPLPDVPGTLRQETHLRFYVPVKRLN